MVAGGAKAATAAVGVGIAAFAGLTTAAVDSCASLEQNIGGIETLFKDNADTVIKNANNAYKTAGLSANAYMETVTSFSASLLQSLDGDTKKAAESADQALVDMADNANKMGTSMESIQNAYQGFAKQNYTMLDNLKLGYGGTKEEMQRLLADAQELSGVEYDISNLSDVYSAIHVIQTELGITGTTAKEAESTISGSMASAKAAFDNFLNGSGDAGQLVDSVMVAVDNIVDNLADIVPRLAEGITDITVGLIPYIEPMLSELLPTFIDGAVALVDGIVTALPGILTALSNVIPIIVEAIATTMPLLLNAGIQIIQMLINGIQQNSALIVQSVITVVNQLVTTFLQMLPQIIQIGLQVIVQLALGIAQALPSLIPTIVDVILQIVEVLISNIGLLVDAAIAIIVALTEGIILALPILIEKAPEIIAKLCTAIVENLDKILNAALQIIIMLGKGLIENIPTLVKNIPKIIQSIVDAFALGATSIYNIGKNIVDGIWNGLKEGWGSVVSWIKDAAGNIVNTAKEALGIHSPSKKFKWLGEMCVAGFDEGVEDLDGSVDMSKGINATAKSMKTNYRSSNHNNHQVNVYLEGDAKGVFKLVRTETRNFIKAKGYEPFRA